MSHFKDFIWRKLWILEDLNRKLKEYPKILIKENLFFRIVFMFFQILQKIYFRWILIIKHFVIQRVDIGIV